MTDRLRQVAGTAALMAGGAGAGVLLTLALAPFGWWWCSGASAALLFACAVRIPTGRRGLLLGLAFGLGKYGSGVSWVFVSIHVYGEAPVPLAVFLTTLFVGLLALFPALLVGAWIAVIRGRWALLNVLSFASLWTLVDWGLTWFLTGFPWLFPGYAHTDTVLGGLAPVVGVLGIGWLVVAGGAALVALLDRRAGTLAMVPRVVLLLLLAVPWAAGAGLQRLPWTSPLGSPIDVLLAQGNIPQERKWERGMAAEILATYSALTQRGGPVALALWPEVAITVGWPAAQPWLAQQVAPAAGDAGPSALITGVLTSPADGSGYRNGAVVVGDGVGIYEKRRLVPFGDYLPFAGVLRGVIRFFDMPFSATTPGDRSQPLLQVGELQVVMAICYEIAFPKLVGDPAGNLIATITNDTWFGRSIGPRQHFQMARMRAMENRRPVIRAANNGITAAVDPFGRVIGRLPQFEPGALRATIQPRSGMTPFMRMGHLPLVLGCTLVVVWGGAMRHRRGVGSSA